jgi:hypothetical protein
MCTVRITLGNGAYGYLSLEPTFHLVSKLNKTVMANDVVAWGMSSSNYVQAAFQNVQ